MIVKIIPLYRLPRHIDILDYLVPRKLESILKIGQLVEIPFRQLSIFGLVFEFDASTNEDKNLKPIIGVVNDIPFVSNEYLFLLHTLSRIYVAPIGSIAKMGLLPLQKNKLKKIELTSIRNSPSNPLKATIYFLYTNQTEHIQLYRNLNNSKITLILVPEVRHIKEVVKLIPDILSETIVEWHSDLSTKEKFSRWLQIRNATKTIIIGTRATLLLPFPKLDKIIIDFEHDENHKHRDQAPRFHTKDIAPLVQQLHPNCKITLASFSPSFDSYYKITKEKLSVVNKKLGRQKLLFKKKTETDKNLPIISIISQQGAYEGVRIFSSAVEAQLQKNLEEKQDDIFIFINKKGSASSVICTDCAYIELDPESGLPLIYTDHSKKLHTPYSNFSKPLPLYCPKCKSTSIKLLGTGSESVEKEIKNMLGKKSKFEVVRIDSDSQFNKKEEIHSKPHIIIGTQMAFHYIDWEKTKLIIFLDVDRQLALPEYLGTEHIWHLIAESQYRRSEQSIFYIQTRNPEHILFKSLGEPDRLYRTELGKRQKLGYPPYVQLARFFYGNYSNFTAQQAADIVFEHVALRLTKTQKNAILLGPFEMQPRFFRNKYWYGFLAKLSNETWTTDILSINQELEIGWKVDPNPISLLSP
ncbi:MAG: primosomal protein N' [Candidatus Magasanikbacteria bacterium]|nr:primosomal protein N' [Candidatus Magasanikbacteria bacterium]